MAFFTNLQEQAKASAGDLQGVARQQFTKEFWFRGLLNMIAVGLVFVVLLKALKKFGPGPVKRIAGKVL